MFINKKDMLNITNENIKNLVNIYDKEAIILYKFNEYCKLF